MRCAPTTRLQGGSSHAKPEAGGPCRLALTGALITVAGLGRYPPKQGGAAVVTFNNDLTTLDPAIGYDWQNWSVIKSIFDGLMDYKPGTTELMPDLAESYTISDDGLTYTFKLRPI